MGVQGSYYLGHYIKGGLGFEGSAEGQSALFCRAGGQRAVRAEAPNPALIGSLREGGSSGEGARAP